MDVLNDVCKGVGGFPFNSPDVFGRKKFCSIYQKNVLNVLKS
jgi:hypothetical protein